VGGKAFPDFLRFLDAWPKARTPRDKLLLIDRLVHALHVDARKRFFRPAAVNVIEGSMRDVNQLLRELAYGPGTTPGVRDTRESWSQTLADIGRVDARVLGCAREADGLAVRAITEAVLPRGNLGGIEARDARQAVEAPVCGDDAGDCKSLHHGEVDEIARGESRAFIG
jgi:hypothetical protein